MPLQKLANHSPAGEGIPHEEILKEFGLTWEDWDRMGQTPLDAPQPPARR